MQEVFDAMIDQPLAASPSPSASRPGGSRRLPAAMLAAGILVGNLAGGAAGAALVSRTQPAGAPLAGRTVSSPRAATAPSPGSVTALYQQDAPAVVTISTEVGRPAARSFGEATGSGIVVDQQGDILTNQHVVAGARQIQVTFSDGTTAAGTLRGADASADLAVVHVDVSSAALHPIALGDSDVLQVGDAVYAIGAPFGLSGSLTAGIVSGLHRSSAAPSGRTLTGLIQTDAAINPGNSGGALVDAAGALIGINESIQSPIQGNVGVGFAIPINAARALIPDLARGVAVQHPGLGISGQSITPAVADSLGLKPRAGVLVVDVVSGGPADRAGLRGTGSPSASDDIITAIDGHDLPAIDRLTQYLDGRHVGDQVTLTVVRGGGTIWLKVTLADFSAR